jgi:hypothetical protein
LQRAAPRYSLRVGGRGLLSIKAYELHSVRTRAREALKLGRMYSMFPVSRIRIEFLRIRKEFLRIRISGSGILNYGSRSGMPINYRSGFRQEIFMAIKKICCQIGNISLKIYKILNFFLNFFEPLIIYV